MNPRKSERHLARRAAARDRAAARLARAALDIADGAPTGLDRRQARRVARRHLRALVVA